jgi:hypothetical protein
MESRNLSLFLNPQNVSIKQPSKETRHTTLANNEDKRAPLRVHMGRGQHAGASLRHRAEKDSGGSTSSIF